MGIMNILTILKKTRHYIYRAPARPLWSPRQEKGRKLSRDEISKLREIISIPPTPTYYGRG